MSDEVKKTAPARVGVRLVKSRVPYSDSALLAKAENMTQIEADSVYAAGDWISHPYNFDGVEQIASQSTILPQCITAYKNNVCGFGLSIDYRDEYKQLDEKEHPELAEEYDRVQRVLDLLVIEQDTKDMFGAIVATREKFGIAYVEVMRNLDGEVVEIKNISRPGTMYMTRPRLPYIATTFYYKGEPVEHRKKFRAFKQEVDGEVVYYREFGDPRVMDWRTGRYIDEKKEKLEIKYRANEIIALPIGDKPYGEMRWIGQVTGMDGARKAEALNANYFENGRHTPMMIMVEGGTLSDESFAKLQEYMEDIKGARGQHAFMVLESETSGNRVQTGFEETVSPKITVKDLSPMLQKDELFQDYIDNARKKVQSAFLLPDLYVGYTTDFNRATAQTAMEVTEKQVFIPYRQEMAWLINRRLLADYQFKYCEVSFRAPDITNPDDQSKILNIVERAGGLTPNEAHRLAGTMVGDTAEDFTGEWADMPLSVQKVIMGSAPSLSPSAGDGFRAGSAGDLGPQSGQRPDAPTASDSVEPEIMEQVEQKIAAAESTGSDELIAVMRQVRKALVELTESQTAPAEPQPEPVPEPVKAAMNRFMMRPAGDAK